MFSTDIVIPTLEWLNETLTATVVIISVSFLLYNMAGRTRSRVATASAVVLLCVTIAYVIDVFMSLDPADQYRETVLRLQWLGIAYTPAALLHLSDALLATTGRPSRGRRRRIVWLSYLVGTAFAALALLTDLIVDLPQGVRVLNRLSAGPWFPAYVIFVMVLASFAMINVVRARRRCLTRYTRRRMTYLLVVFLAPLYGVFPYSVVFGVGDEQTARLLVVLNLSNVIVLMMLVFMAYPLSFFGSDKPDRVIRARLLEFLLRGPLTGAVILSVILFVPRATNVLGVDGDAMMPFAAVAVLLLLQWSITLLMPYLQRWLIYTNDQQRAQWLQQIGDRLLTRSDASQLLESVLAAICDQLRVPTAFVARIDPEGAELIQVVGSLVPSPESLSDPEFTALMQADDDTVVDSGPERVNGIFVWHSYWMVPLRQSRRILGEEASAPLLGLLGIWARAPRPDFDEEEKQVFDQLVWQARDILEDFQLQTEVFVILQGLASQIDSRQEMRGVTRYGHVEAVSNQARDLTADPDFSDLIKDALRDYWGGPKLTESELLRLNIVWQEMMHADDNNPVRALRNVLAQAIENLKPEGERSLTTTEWILYNILEMRFLQGRKVRDVALRLAMSESDLYRKQRVAIEEVAKQIAEMERDSIAHMNRSSADDPEAEFATETRDEAAVLADEEERHTV